MAEQLRHVKQQTQKAANHYKTSLKSRTFVIWSTTAQGSREEKRLLELHHDRRQRIAGLMLGLSQVAEGGGGRPCLNVESASSNEQEEGLITSRTESTINLHESDVGSIASSALSSSYSQQQTSKGTTPTPQSTASRREALTNKEFRERQEARAREREQKKLLIKER